MWSRGFCCFLAGDCFFKIFMSQVENLWRDTFCVVYPGYGIIFYCYHLMLVTWKNSGSGAKSCDESSRFNCAVEACQHVLNNGVIESLHFLIVSLCQFFPPVLFLLPCSEST
jgi:hypothetical protein